MVFSSTTFLYLYFPTVIAVYYLILRKNRYLQNIFLLFASLFFYAWGEPKFVLVMIASILINWGLGLAVDHYKENCRISMAKWFVCISVIINLSILFIFKYLTFFNEEILAILGKQIVLPVINLPIGISFFTFQAMSYVIDVYRGHGAVQNKLSGVGLYISFFPQLIAGPIVRYETIADEIENRIESLEDFTSGVIRFILGLGKKVLIANNVAAVADVMFAETALSVASAWLGAICYTLQIYFDFSGYSDMAIGLGKMFGFHFLENFNYPYISNSVSEFWRRWHMSLGSWFRDYVYIPLGGNRVSSVRTVINVFVVWSLTGIWHGANWTFLVWGLLYFILLSIEKNLNYRPKKVFGIGNAYTMLFVILGWVLFRADTIYDAARFIGNMFGIGALGIMDTVFIQHWSTVWFFVFIGVIFSMPLLSVLKNRIDTDTVGYQIIKVTAILGILVLSVVQIVCSSYNPFIYFNF